jgi:hypothetical protein
MYCTAKLAVIHSVDISAVWHCLFSYQQGMPAVSDLCKVRLLYLVAIGKDFYIVVYIRKN